MANLSEEKKLTGFVSRRRGSRDNLICEALKHAIPSLAAEQDCGENHRIEGKTCQYHFVFVFDVSQNVGT